MGKPLVLSRAMPMLHICGNIHHIAGQKLARGFTPLLIPAFAGNTHEQLSAPFRGMMYMPIVAATGLKSHIGDIDLLG